MTRISLFLAAAMAAVFFSTSSLAATDEETQDRWVIIHAGQLLAVPGEAPVSERSIVVHNQHIDSVRRGFLQREEIDSNGAPVLVIDLSDRFVLPGLIDAHDHITAKPGRIKQVWPTTTTDAMKAIYGAHYAKITLEAGFTTVRNIGSSGLAIYALRDGIAKGLVPGPRLLAAGHYISTTGGHGDKSTGFRPDLYGSLDHDGLCDGIESCRRAARLQIKKGADWIKIMATGGVNSEAATGVGLHFDPETLQAIVDAAHALGRKVAAHAHAAEGINAALRAGVDSIEHGAFLDEESIRLFKETDTYLVATLNVGAHVLEIANDPESGMSQAVRGKARDAIPQMDENVAKAYEAGVKIAFGTDSGEPAHGTNADEFLHLVRIGMSEMDAIETATVNAADLLDMSDDVGTIEEGKYADMVATSGDPLEDIAALTEVGFVMKSGKVYKSD